MLDGRSAEQASVLPAAGEEPPRSNDTPTAIRRCWKHLVRSALALPTTCGQSDRMESSAAGALLRLQREMVAAQASFISALQRRDSPAMKAASEQCASLFQQIKAAQHAATSDGTGAFPRIREAGAGRTS